MKSENTKKIDGLTLKGLEQAENFVEEIMFANLQKFTNSLNGTSEQAASAWKKYREALKILVALKTSKKRIEREKSKANEFAVATKNSFAKKVPIPSEAAKKETSKTVVSKKETSEVESKKNQTKSFSNAK